MVLVLEGFSKAYKGTPAVQGLSCEVKAGDVLALVGPNGAGKTTTMRCVAGIIPPSAGRISVAGFDVQKKPVEAKGRLAYVPDDPKLFDALTVDEHLEFAAAAYRVQNWEATGEALMKRFELTEHRRKPAIELSRGMRQKVAICCAYLHEPGLVMLDEPLTGLDPRGIRTMKETISERAAAGAAVIVSSHLLQLVEGLCNRLLILHKGRRVFFGDFEELRRAFAGGGADASLEEVFFRATEGAPGGSAVNPALLKLMRMQVRGWFRRQFSGGSIRRTVFAALGTVMFLLWFGSIVIGAAYQTPRTPEQILSTLPFFLTGFALLPLVFGNEDRAIAFTPAEIDFLFAGPFGRRELILFKMLKLVLSSLAGGIFFALLLRRYSGSVAAGIIGASLALTFINLFATVICLVRDTVEERAYQVVRKGATLALIAAVAGVVWQVNRTGAPTEEQLRELAASPMGQAVLAPAKVFAQVFAAQSVAECAAWAGACLGMIVGAVLVVLALDRGYMEAALAASQRRQARLARLRKGMVISGDKPVRRVRLPRLTALGAPGAIVKRQLITAFRTSRGWLVIFVLAAAYGYFVSRVMSEHTGTPGIAGLTPGFVMLLTMLPQMLRFDFRSELDHMDLLKSLPITAGSVATAELAVPSLILSLQVWVVEGVVAVFMPVEPGVLVMAALAVPPLAVLVIALENFVFLMIPSRLISPGQGGAGAAFSGRRLVMLLARMVLILVGGGLVGGVSLGAWAVSGSIELTYAAGWATLLLIAAGVVRAVAWAYRRFDVSADMPV